MEEVKTTKKCNKCGKELSISEFYKKSGAIDGLQYYCKECQRKASSKTKNFLNPELAKFQPRELISELRARGYKGELTYTQTIHV